MKPTWSLALFNLFIAVTFAHEPTSDQLRNWHQWRGPLATGVAVDADPPLEWSESRNVRWKVSVPGRGLASPVIWDQRLFLLTAIETERAASDLGPSDPGRSGFTNPTPNRYFQFVVLCFDRRDGRLLWRRTANEAVPREGLHVTNSHASGSAITNGQYVYASFGSHGIFCFDMEGNPIWQRDLGRMRTRNAFGEGSSPALHGDTLVVTWDHEGPSFITALDARTGETRWRVERDEPTTWATPLLVEHDGRMQVVTNGKTRVRGYDLETGELLWECGGQGTNPIACPVALDGVAFCMTGYRGYAVYALPLDARGDLAESQDIVWKRTDAGPYVSSPVLHEGQLYFTKARDAIVYAVDARSGEPRFGPERLPGLNSLYASPVAAAGRIYFTGRNGATTVIKHAKEFEVLATNQLDEGIDASPAIVGDEIFIRGERHLYCLGRDG